MAMVPADTAEGRRCCTTESHETNRQPPVHRPSVPHNPFKGKTEAGWCWGLHGCRMAACTPSSVEFVSMPTCSMCGCPLQQHPPTWQRASSDPRSLPLHASPHHVFVVSPFPLASFSPRSFCEQVRLCLAKQASLNQAAPLSDTPFPISVCHHSPTHPCPLPQVRLCLAKQDYVRAQILSRKVSPRAFVERKGEAQGEIGIEGTAIEEADKVRGWVRQPHVRSCAWGLGSSARCVGQVGCVCCRCASLRLAFPSGVTNGHPGSGPGVRVCIGCLWRFA